MRHLALALLLLACREPEPDPVDTDADTDTDTDSDSDTLEPASEQVDVLVIGAGPAGLSAAYSANQAGLDVLVLEREPKAGGSGWYAGRFYGAMTAQQRSQGVIDTLEDATNEWTAWSAGGDGDDPAVQQLILRSSEVLEWIEYDLGAEVNKHVFTEMGFGGLPRVHDVAIEGGGALPKLIESQLDRIRLSTEATTVVFEDGRVVGAAWRDMETGEQGWIRASATIVATGGFARNLERVLTDRPELEGMRVLSEIAPSSDGGGIHLLETAGAVWQNQGNYGIYAHSLGDFREGMEAEALWIPGLHHSVFLDLEGNRPANEEMFAGFELVERLVELPERRMIAVMPSSVYFDVEVEVPVYNHGRSDGTTEFGPDELIDAGVAQRFADTASLAEFYGMEPTTVDDTFARYEGYVAAGKDEQHGKHPDGMVSFGGDYVGFELYAGAAKAFTGFDVDVDGRIVNAAGAPIPGLYAAGEVIGMLGTPEVGKGFTGSITGVYLTGLVAGETAAADIAD